LLVRIEHEAGRVGALQEHHADVRHSVLVDGRERHRVRVVGLAPLRIAEPFGEEGEGVVMLAEVTGY
jgi:hypothetical protein